MQTTDGIPAKPSTTLMTIYSVLADHPQYRISQIYDGREPTATWTGEAEVGDLEDVFAYFNRAFDADVERLERIGYRLPSLSVGDVVVIGSDYHIVCSLGFAEITEDDYTAIVAAHHDDRHRVAWQIARDAAADRQALLREGERRGE